MLAAATGDRFGRRKVFVAGPLIFTAASAAAALAPGIGWLIAARAVQGVGAAVIMSLSLTLLTAAVPERGKRAFSRIAAISDVHVLITDSSAPADELDRLRAAEVEVVVA